MFYLKHWPISRRIALAVSIPLFAAIGFGSVIIFESWRTMDTTSRMAAATSMSPLFGAFIHELQIERGLTNTILRHPENRAALEARNTQTSRVDSALDELRRTIESMPSDVSDRDAANARAALKHADELLELRAAVSKGAIEPGAAVTRYTGLIDAALAPIEALTQDAQVGPIARDIIAYSSVLRGKEAAGLERATGAGAFTTQGFDKTQYGRFVSLGSAQDSFLAVARRFGSPEQAARVTEFAASAPEKEMRDLRLLADRAVMQGENGVEPLAWFRAATQRIDALKLLEDAFSRDLSHSVADSAKAARRSLTLALALVVALSAIAALAAYAVANSIARPLKALTANMRRLASGDTSTPLMDADRLDEIGDMMRAVAIFRDNAVMRAHLEQAALAERKKELHRQSRMQELIERFRGAVGEVVASVSAEAVNMSGTARILTDVAFRAENTAGSARTAASDSSAHIGAVSAAAEELTASIAEISQQMRAASERVGKATEFARQTDRGVSGLANLGNKIGAIVEMIRSIAQQTNLLALNATIEAARAGDAGKGFAVVASEVKTLAGQTSKATDEIAAQVSAIQAATHGAVEDIRSITAAVSEIDTLTAAVAVSIEQQSFATDEIARAISRASDSSSTSSQNIADVAAVVGETNSEAGRVTATTGLLSDSARTLAETVNAFLRDLTIDIENRRADVRNRTTQGVVLTIQGRKLKTTLVDISDTGVKIVAVDGMRDCDRFIMEFEDENRAAARTVWLKDGFAGVEFDRPLSAITGKKAA